MYSILHISDLHRTPGHHVTNDELISALIRDRAAYTGSPNPIRAPDAIVVSGDIVQGVPLGAANSASVLNGQYDEAFKFLAELTDRFLSGDRSRVVIVPGNHDIDWNVAKAAMRLVEAEKAPQNLPQALYDLDSTYRWSWKTRELFEVYDQQAYDKRLDAFWQFFGRFYDGIDGLRLNAGSDANLFSLDDGRIALAAFNSCYGNDCYRFHGALAPGLVARTDIDLQGLGSSALNIAVWHHNIEGPPYSTEYMDVETVRGMVGRGFRLGLYGHQHHAKVSSQVIYLADDQIMGVAGTGTLCAGRNELPAGTNRQYSLVEISDDYLSATIHVRELADGGMFAPAALTQFRRGSSKTITWSQSTDLSGETVYPLAVAAMSSVLRAERIGREGQPAQAAQMLWPLRDRLPAHGNRLLLEFASAAGEWAMVAEATKLPDSAEGFLLGIEARLRLGMMDAAAALLASEGIADFVGEADLLQISERINSERILRG